MPMVVVVIDNYHHKGTAGTRDSRKLASCLSEHRGQIDQRSINHNELSLRRSNIQALSQALSPLRQDELVLSRAVSSCCVAAGLRFWRCSSSLRIHDVDLG